MRLAAILTRPVSRRGFTVHKKLEKLMEQRVEMGHRQRELGMGELPLRFAADGGTDVL